ncbi:MAG: c-type cytochrome [Bacteroidetes bacterium]|nr:c-type cytochrome [Bacteroidota bacterium]MBS1539605.1 c-type cytochrome [Bacteroidota bacterium]
MKKILLPIAVAAISLFSCAPDKSKVVEELPTHQDAKESGPEANQADVTKGIGAIKEVKLTHPLDQERVTRGTAIYEMKCQACHKLDDQRLVGPGWKDVTKRRQPEWIMNMILNVDVMLDKDEEAQKLLELCLTRMPNQNVSIGDARDILEFMRKNDGEK